jgi:hypothetical protein
MRTWIAAMVGGAALAACATAPAPAAQLSDAELAELRALTMRLDDERPDLFQDMRSLGLISYQWRVCGVGRIAEEAIVARLVEAEPAELRAAALRFSALDQRQRAASEPAATLPWYPCDGAALDAALVWLGAHPPSPWVSHAAEAAPAPMSDEELDRLARLQLSIPGAPSYGVEHTANVLGRAARSFVWCGGSAARAAPAMARLVEFARLPEDSAARPAFLTGAAIGVETAEAMHELYALSSAAGAYDVAVWARLGIDRRLRAQLCTDEALREANQAVAELAR